MGNSRLTGKRALVVDDEEVVIEAVKAVLQRCGVQVDGVTDPYSGRDLAINGPYQLVLLDMRMPELDGLSILGAIRERRSDLEVIIITGYSSVATAVKAVKLGAFDYLAKPFLPEDLVECAGAAMEALELRRAERTDPPALSSRLVGISEGIAEVRSLIARVAGSDATVLVVGETGTGKEVVAAEIHAASPCRDGPFVSVDCSALAPGLLESELFGHLKGAFTGAHSSKPGLLEIAQGGTLFLDEVCNLSLETQGKLLRFLETGEFRPVGGVETKRVKFRLVAATNRDLEQLVAERTFRQDLYYRLNVLPVRLPPLRDRRLDIPVLVRHFLAARAGRGVDRPRRISPEALDQLGRYAWPGNVRELKNLMDRLMVMVEEDVIQVRHIPPHITSPEAGPGPEVPRTNEELKEMKQVLRDHMYRQLERSFVIEALRRTGWNVSRAARETGLHRPNFHALMRKHGVRAGQED